MATPTYDDVVTQIDTYIIANGNNEITANVLNPILKIITDFSNNTIGNLATLSTSAVQNIVDAINSLKSEINNITNNGIQLYIGYNTPLITPPPIYNYADYYMELDYLDATPIQLWQWNGFEWNTVIYSSSVPSFYKQYYTYTGVGVSVPENLDGTVDNMDNPQAEVTSVISDGILTITAGVIIGDRIKVYGIY